MGEAGGQALHGGYGSLTIGDRSLKPHTLERDGKLEPASAAELAAAVAQHQLHGGIGFFPRCGECQAARECGDYPYWFPPGMP